MNKRAHLARLMSLLAAGMMSAHAYVYAHQTDEVRSPVPGVLCDQYMCANDKGISRPLTAKYLHKKAVTKLFSQGKFSLTEFTFANGIFCDAKARLCRENRYYGADGKPSGPVSKKYTALLFGK